MFFSLHAVNRSSHGTFSVFSDTLDLDFIPVVTEEYDLVIPEEHFESENIKFLLKTINTDDFKTRVEALGGYGTEKTGEIII